MSIETDSFLVDGRSQFDDLGFRQPAPWYGGCSPNAHTNELAGEMTVDQSFNSQILNGLDEFMLKLEDSPTPSANVLAGRELVRELRLYVADLQDQDVPFGGLEGEEIDAFVEPVHESLPDSDIENLRIRLRVMLDWIESIKEMQSETGATQEIGPLAPSTSVEDMGALGVRLEMNGYHGERRVETVNTLL